MTFTRTATLPVGLTAYAVTESSGEGKLRIVLNQGSTADLTAEDAIELAKYIRYKFPEETSI